MSTISPTFSVLVPTYNQADYLAKALDSLIAQTDPDWEAVVVNDGSTDHTHEVLEAYAARDSRISPYQKENGGTGAALNKGLEVARGEWICWLSSDDLFEPDKLALHREWINRFPEARFFFTYFKLYREATGYLEERHDLWGPLPERSYQTLGLLHRNFISGITICVHSSVFRELGGFDTSLRYGQDYDRWLWVTSRYPGIFIPAWTVVNRNHAGQGSEVFPQACSFDSAKAAIRFLGKNSYPQLFPLLETRRFDVALDALEAGLKTAANPDAFFYWMGVHPGLLFCMYDWLSVNGDGRNGGGMELLWNRLETFAAQETAKHRGNFGSLWRHALMTARLRPLTVQRDGISPEAVGRCHNQHLRVTHPEQVQGLARYFEEFMNGEMQYGIEPNLAGREVAVVAPLEGDPREAEAACWAARLLAAAGGAVTLVKPGDPAVGYQEGVLVLHVPDANALEKCTRGLRPWDFCAPLAGAPSVPATTVLRLSVPGTSIEGCTPIPAFGGELASQAGSFAGIFSTRELPPPPSQPVPSLVRRLVRKCRSGGRIALDSAPVRKARYFVGTRRKRIKTWWEGFTRINAARLGAWAVTRYCPGNAAFDAFKQRGFFLLRDHYYLPLPDFQDLTSTFMESRSEMVGIELDETRMLRLIEETLAPYNEEFRAFPVTRTTAEITRFYLINGGYMAVDGNSVLRARTPPKTQQNHRNGVWIKLTSLL